MKNSKKKCGTSTPVKYYIIMMLAGVFVIFLHTLLTGCEQFRAFLSAFLMNLLEFLAAGIFPGVIVAFLTDCVNTKQKKNDYEEFYKASVNVLRTMCENLPATLHACVTDIYQKENAPETAWDAKKTFKEWCFKLASSSDTEQIAYLNQDCLQIKAEAEKALRNLSAYQGWRVKENNDALDDLIKSCNSLFTRTRRTAGVDHSAWKLNCNSDKFIRAVLAVFPPELPENKDIKLGYTQPFNSDDYCD